MIFALATDENSLHVFPTAREAIDYCECIDVVEGGWLFWDESGTALVPEFLVPSERGRFVVGGGIYTLVPSPREPSLSASLPGIAHLHENPHFASLPAILAHLKLRLAAPGTGASPGP